MVWPRVVGVLAVILGFLATPLAAEAQQAGTIYRIGFVASAPPSVSQPFLATFRAGFRELGYVDGLNVIIEQRWAGGASDRLFPLAAELVRLKVDLIFAWATPAVTAAKQATSVVPIVIVGVRNPAALGFVASLARPGGNITGVSGRAGTPGNAYCIRVGLKTRDGGEVAAAYLDSIRPVMAACGLRFPSRDELPLDLPPPVDLSVPVGVA